MSAADPQQRGVVAWFVQNHLAANLLFAFLIVAGALSLLRLRLAVFPEVEPDVVTVTVPYPGATPTEVEDAILLRVEDAVADVEGIEEIRSTAVQSQGTVTVEIRPGADNRRVLDDVESAVGRIAELPPRADEPIVADPLERRRVTTLVLYGDVSRSTLERLAERVERDLETSGTISTVTVQGLPELEVSVELDDAALRRYDLTFDAVARAVRESSFDLPAGTLDGERAEFLVRTVGQAYTGDAFRELVLRTAADGSVIRLGDVATVVDGFADADFGVRLDGQTAVLLNVFRVGEEGALRVRETVLDYVERARGNLPPGVGIAQYDDRARSLQSRIWLLVKNGALGLVLVLVLLSLFLELRLAGWVAAGLAMSFVGSLAILPFFDVGIHQLSLFGFILVLGIVVDDAIVVGENVFARRQRGESWREAAVAGTREVLWPVILVVASTILAFLPMLGTRGEVGKIIFSIPIVVSAVLLLSLVEALLILPAHLAAGSDGGSHGRIRRGIDRARGWASGGLEGFVAGPMRRLVDLAVRWRGITLGAAAALLLITVGFVGGGWIERTFLPDINANRVVATLEMAPGTAAPETERRLATIAAAAEELRAELGGGDGDGPIRHIGTAIGGQPWSALTGQRETGGARGPRLGEVVLALSPAGERTVAADDLADRWQERVPELPGVKTLSFQASLFAAGAAVSVRLSHPDPAIMRRASRELQDELRRIDGVREIGDSWVQGVPQVRITGLTPVGHALGFRRGDVARQVRAAAFGLEAERVQRGRDEVRVYVRMPEAEQASVADLASLWIRRPPTAAEAAAADGRGQRTSRPIEAPLAQVAEYEIAESLSKLTRAERRRVITVTADVDPDVVRGGEVNASLIGEILPQLVERHPDLDWSIEGEQADQSEALVSLAVGLLIAVFAIYVLMAVRFGSYVHPLIILSAIPFGVLGAVYGHAIVGLLRPMPLSFMSMFGIVALAGVVVNDTLILIDLINRSRAEDDGRSLHEIIVDSAERRARPILLTTLTTFFALIPLIFEPSLQAQFLIPTAVSLGFGVLFASLVTLLVVPAAYVLVEQARDWFGMAAPTGSRSSAGDDRD